MTLGLEGMVSRPLGISWNVLEWLLPSSMSLWSESEWFSNVAAQPESQRPLAADPSVSLATYACMHVCVCMHACMYASMYACMHVCMYVKMHEYICVYIHNLCSYTCIYVCVS